MDFSRSALTNSDVLENTKMYLRVIFTHVLGIRKSALSSKINQFMFISPPLFVFEMENIARGSRTNSLITLAKSVVLELPEANHLSRSTSSSIRC